MQSPQRVESDRIFSCSQLTLSLVCWIAFATPAIAFDFLPELLVYQEDFLGESVYPTSPEVDLTLAGGLSGRSIPSGAGGPTLTGTQAHAAVSPTTDLFEAVDWVSSTLGIERFGIRGEFSGWVAATNSGADASVRAVFDTDTTNNVNVESIVELVRNSSDGLTALFGVSVGDGGFGISDAAGDTLDPAEASALASGVPFTLDLSIDRDASNASATLDISGFPTRSLGPVSLAVIDRLDPVVNGSLTFIDVGGGGLSQVDFDQLAVYREFSTTFVVNTTTDAVDDDPGDGLCRTALNTCSLRAAIQESNARVGAGEILLSEATYPLTIPGTDEDLSATGDLDVLDSLVLRGADRYTTIIDGGAIDRVLHLRGFGGFTPVHIADVTLRNGLVASPTDSIGGGLSNEAYLTITRCVIAANVANRVGGLLNRNFLDMDDCVIRNNEAQDLGLGFPEAGGMANGATFLGTNIAIARIRNSAIVNNIGPNVGGIVMGNGTLSRLENTTVSGNSDRQIDSFNINVEIIHSTIVGEASISLSIGSFDGSRTLEISNSVIVGPTACNFGSTNPANRTFGGNNASSDTSCGFTAPGSIENASLGLLPLLTARDSAFHLLSESSPLLDGADASECLSHDQIGSVRPLDGDESGTAECDIGAIEVPEPGVMAMLWVGSIGLFGARAFASRSVQEYDVEESSNRR